MRTLRPSVHPSSRSRSRNAVTRRCASRSFSLNPVSTPMRRTRSLCCAPAARGHAAAAPPSAASNSRRLMMTVIRPSRARCVKWNDTTPRACSLAVQGGQGAGCFDLSLRLQLHYSRRRDLANAAIAASRVANMRCIAVLCRRASWPGICGHSRACVHPGAPAARRVAENSRAKVALQSYSGFADLLPLPLHRLPLERTSKHLAAVRAKLIVRHLPQLLVVRRVFHEFEKLIARRLGIAFHQPLKELKCAGYVPLLGAARIAEVRVAVGLV